MTHDLLTLQSVKAAEYLIAVSYLFCFIVFWRFINGGSAAAREARASGWTGHIAGWFAVPEHVHFHPGHAWAHIADGELVTVGMDDFAHRLVGHAAITLPAVGTTLGQGERAWTLESEGKSVDMLSPVDGTVVEVNERLREAPETLDRDPYGEGWLVKVRAPRVAANAKHLLKGSLARRWMEEACEGLQGLMSPELGRLYQDGGLPVYGMAKSLDAARWDTIARGFLLS
jgi:glycine cleavage system H protein